jgi:hypothetical protein
VRAGTFATTSGAPAPAECPPPSKSARSWNVRRGARHSSTLLGSVCSPRSDCPPPSGPTRRRISVSTLRRPARVGYVHLRAINCRCHRSKVSGVTIVAIGRMRHRSRAGGYTTIGTQRRRSNCGTLRSGRASRPPSLSTEVLICHYHLPQPNFLLMSVDPLSRIRVDVFPDLIGSLEAAEEIIVEGPRCPSVACGGDLRAQVADAGECDVAR